MTWEEAIEELERLLRHWDDLENGKRCFWGYDNEAVALALSALRPVNREQVEKVWKGEWKLIGAGKTGRGGIWYCTRCEKCYPYTCDFCPRCGAPMTDEAVQMVMERWKEALENG